MRGKVASEAGIRAAAGVLVALVGIGFFLYTGHAQQPAAPPPMTIEQVKPGLYAILNPGSNTLAVRVTNDGVLLVDAMYERNHDQIIALVKTVTGQPIRYIVNSHHHTDHTNGNQRFLPGATIVAHDNARANMMRGPDPMPGPPIVTYTTEAAIHVGNAEVQLHHLGEGHTNGDTIVYFPDLRVITTGDLFTVGLGRVPPIDYANGGTALGWVRTIDSILKTLDFDTIIPGHGPVVKRADLEQHRERLLTLQMRTRELIKQGVPKDQYLTKLRTDDLGWKLEPNAGFARTAAEPFYDEMAKGPR